MPSDVQRDSNLSNQPTEQTESVQNVKENTMTNTTQANELWNIELLEKLNKETAGLTTEALGEILEQAVLYSQEHAEARKDETAAKDMPIPQVPKQFDSIEDLVRNNAERHKAQKERDTATIAANKRANEASKALSLIHRIIGKYLPTETWVRTPGGNCGVGISFTNWGGNHYNLEVTKWQEKMPNLDHRHRGD